MRARIIKDARLGGAKNLLCAEVWFGEGDPGLGKRPREVWVVDYDRYRDESWEASNMLAVAGTGGPLLARFSLDLARKALDWFADDSDGIVSIPEHDLSQGRLSPNGT